MRAIKGGHNLTLYVLAFLRNRYTMSPPPLAQAPYRYYAGAHGF